MILAGVGAALGIAGIVISLSFGGNDDKTETDLNRGPATQPADPVKNDPVAQPTPEAPKPPPTSTQKPPIQENPPITGPGLDRVANHETPLRPMDIIRVAGREWVRGNYDVAKQELSRLSQLRPLNQHPPVKEALLRYDHFGFRAALLGVIEPTGGDQVLIWEVFQETQARMARSSTVADWGEGEVAWLSALLRAGIQSAGAVDGAPEGLASFLPQLQVKELVEAAVDAVAKQAIQHREQPDSRWPAVLRELARQHSGSDAGELAAIGLMRASATPGDRRGLLNDPELALAQIAMLEVALSEQLLPLDDLLPMARGVLAGVSAGDTAGQEAAARVLRGLTTADSDASLSLARELVAKPEVRGALKRAALAAIARHGTDQERSELIDRAKATGFEGVWAFEGLLEGGAEVPHWEIFERGQNPVVRAMALEKLAASDQREKALDQALSPGAARPLRTAAAALLDPTDEKELARAFALAETDRDPLVRRAVLDRLATLKDKSMKPFFQARAGADEDQSIRAYCRQLAEALGE